MLAAFLKEPSFQITEAESAKLAAAITRVSELYEVPMLDERSRAWLGLGMVGVEVYGTRLAAAVVAAKQRPHVVTPIKPAAAEPRPVIIDQQAGAYATQA
jgi:hypothetical protein